jgi:choice-of-anchor C domain-containing protein
MFHSLLKRHLLIFIPCILIIGAMIPLATFAKSASSDQHRMLTAHAVPNVQIVKDGSFEKPNVGGGVNLVAGQTFGAWTVGSGDIDVVGTNWWMARNGVQSVDLNGLGPGSIYQDLSTNSGTQYSLSFALAGDPVCGPQVKEMQVYWGTNLVDDLMFDITGHSGTKMGWKVHKYQVQATGSTTRLSFVSLTQQSACGPALDSVTVKG